MGALVRAALAAVCLVVLQASACPAARAQEGGLLRAEQAPPGAVWLEDLGLEKMSAGWGQARARMSIEQKPITLHGVVYPHGVGTHALSEALVDLRGAAARFQAMVGVDDERAGLGSVVFQIYVDGQKAADSGAMRGGDVPKLLSVDLRGKKQMLLVADDAEDGVDNDHADWAGAMLMLAPGATARPAIIDVPAEPPPPIASGTKPAPAIHGPRVVGATPGRPFLFLVPVTGEGPLRYEARGLPAGLRLDAATGVITGSLRKAGTFRVALTVAGAKGTAQRRLTIVGGQGKLALTPPMGWNSWYVWYTGVTQKHVQDAADGLVKSGLAAHGYAFVNIDDGWEDGRTAQGEIRANEKFPDMKALGDHIHALGLKFGIYTSPGPKTCGGFEGSYQHEAQDAGTYAGWGVDFVKHDWCSYGDVAGGGDAAALQKPYQVMRAAIDATGRDMVYSLCQYGMGKVWEWGAQVGGNLWRTTGDSGDTWGSISSIGFAQNGLGRYAGPGRWNDPDMIMAGSLNAPDGKPKPTRLTPNEQITQMTLWSMAAAPLLLSCDLSRVDRFTLDLLTNDEILDVDQDPLGRAGRRVARVDRTEVWSRPLFDGTVAVALFNRGAMRATVTALWKDLGLEGSQPVRDLWLQRDLGVLEGQFSAGVPAHGAMLLKIGRPAAGER